MSVTQAVPVTDAVPVTGTGSTALRPWTPPGVSDDMAKEQGLRYVLVDEIVGDVVTLAVASWPGSDDLGRVRFPDGPACGHLVVHRRELRERLYEGWLRRDPRVGDAFATVPAGAVLDELASSGQVLLDEHLRLADALPGPVVDLSAEARTVAKLAFYAAVAGVQSHDIACELGQDKYLKDDGSAPVRLPGQVKSEKWRGPVVHLPTAAVGRSRWSVPDKRWPAPEQEDLVEAIRANPTALVYFLLNVGDGDAQLMLLPTDPAAAEPRPRRAIVVDAGTTGKLPPLLADLAAAGLIAPAGGRQQACALIVATHPHDDHIEGLAELVHTYGHDGIGDVWEPGYFAPTRSFAELMAEVEDARIPHCEPTAGMVRYVDGVKITALAPAVQLRTAYDTYGVDCNDASIVLKIEFPAARITSGPDGEHTRRRDVKLSDPWSIILGADAQTRSWSHVTADFVPLHRGQDGELFKALRKAAGRDWLAADILKVSHHASKHGINIELIERVHPSVSLISSVGGGGRYGFPHALATQAIAEALAPSTRKNTQQPDDADLGIHYTGGVTDDGRALGSVALLVPAQVRGRLRMWRFGDGPKDPVELAAGRLLAPIRARS
jgi:hypothetical protein